MFGVNATFGYNVVPLCVFSLQMDVLKWLTKSRAFFIFIISIIRYSALLTGIGNISVMWNELYMQGGRTLTLQIYMCKYVFFLCFNLLWSHPIQVWFYRTIYLLLLISKLFALEYICIWCNLSQEVKLGFHFRCTSRKRKKTLHP